jgi:sodium ion-translocating decarboxylase beta subunit
MEIWLAALSSLTQGITNLGWQNVVMVAIGCALLYLGIAKKVEPFLLVPIGFGITLGNLPLAGLSTRDEGGILNTLYTTGILSELFPCLLFIGLGAMIDFGPVLANPIVLLFGAAGQFGIFLTLFLALWMGFLRQEAVSIAVIGACDGPTAIFVASKYAPALLPAVSIAAYSYMSLVPVIQPPIIRAMLSKKECGTVMAYGEKKVSQRVKLLFPLVTGILTILIAPMGAPLMGMLMLGNFMRETGVLGRLVDVSQGTLTNIITLFLGLTIGASMDGATFLRWQTIAIFILGLVAISLDTVAGVLLGKLPDVGTCGTARGPAGEPALLLALACGRREYGRADRLSHGGGGHAGHHERNGNFAVGVILVGSISVSLVLLAKRSNPYLFSVLASIDES